MNNNPQESHTLPSKNKTAPCKLHWPPAEVAHCFSKLESFIAYVRRFKQKNTVIFAQPHYQLKAIIDYHGVDSRALCAHQVTFNCQQTDAWAAWLRTCYTCLSQYEFAAFIAEQAPTLRECNALTLSKAVLNFRVPDQNSFTHGVAFAGYNHGLTFGECILEETGILPEKLLINVAPFAGGDACEMWVLVRYTIKNKSLKVRCQLMFDHNPIGSAYQSLLKNLEDKLAEVPVFQATYSQSRFI